MTGGVRGQGGTVRGGPDRAEHLPPTAHGDDQPLRVVAVGGPVDDVLGGPQGAQQAAAPQLGDPPVGHPAAEDDGPAQRVGAGTGGGVGQDPQPRVLDGDRPLHVGRDPRREDREGRRGLRAPERPGVVVPAGPDVGERRPQQRGGLGPAGALGAGEQSDAGLPGRLHRAGDLRGCDLRTSCLWGCDFRSCDLWGCDLRSGDLRSCGLGAGGLRTGGLRTGDLLARVAQHHGAGAPPRGLAHGIGVRGGAHGQQQDARARRTSRTRTRPQAVQIIGAVRDIEVVEVVEVVQADGDPPDDGVGRGGRVQQPHRVAVLEGQQGPQGRGGLPRSRILLAHRPTLPPSSLRRTSCAPRRR
ncbi:pentapeptide repeat-containing protein [Streptomyces cacaoi]